LVVSGFVVADEVLLPEVLVLDGVEDVLDDGVVLDVLDDGVVAVEELVDMSDFEEVSSTFFRSAELLRVLLLQPVMLNPRATRADAVMTFSFFVLMLCDGFGGGGRKPMGHLRIHRRHVGA
jgi:hypothetical protein